MSWRAALLLLCVHVAFALGELSGSLKDFLGVAKESGSKYFYDSYQGTR